VITAPFKANPFAPRKYGELKKVTDRVFIFRNITNSSFVIGNRSVAVIDTQVNRPTAEALLRSIRTVTDKPVEFVINTHYHWDHTNGNALFEKEGATVVSSKLTKEFMETRRARQKGFLAGRGFELGEDPLLPRVTFEGEFTVDTGGMPLKLFFAGAAETEDATAVFVASENVLMSGDTVMTGSFPIFGQPVWDEGLEGNDSWIRTIQSLAALKPKCIVPGHGPLAHDKEIKLLVKIEEYFLDEVKRLVQKGLDAEAVLQHLEPRLPSWITEIPIVWGTPRYAILRVYRGLTKKKTDPEPGWQRFKPSAVPKADAFALNQKILGKETVDEFLQMASEAQEGGDLGLKLGILKKSSEIFSDSTKALNAYAEALVQASKAEASVLEKGDFFQIARTCWDRAIRLNPKDPEALLGKGRYLTMMAYRGGDDPREGMGLLSKVLELAPGGWVEAEAEFYLGMGYRRLGEETNARAQFEKALTLEPAFMPARLALQC
jgi:glyoxylase-like metal-dependent hydrolase (beta-lactamase superfamily II)